MLTGCSYSPQQLACMHSRDAAQRHGGIAGVGVAVLLVLAAVTAYVRRHPSPAPRAGRGLLAAALTATAVIPVAVVCALLGSAWAGRNYHCGDGQDLPLGLLLMLAVLPAAIALPATGALLLWAKRLCYGRQADRVA
jgi:hypothetical protein